MVTLEENIENWQQTLKTLDKEASKNYFGPNPNRVALEVAELVHIYIEEKIAL